MFPQVKESLGTDVHLATSLNTDSFSAGRYIEKYIAIASRGNAICATSAIAPGSVGKGSHCHLTCCFFLSIRFHVGDCANTFHDSQLMVYC